MVQPPPLRRPRGDGGLREKSLRSRIIIPQHVWGGHGRLIYIITPCFCSRTMTIGGSYQNVEAAAAYLLFQLLFICNLLPV